MRFLKVSYDICRRSKKEVVDDITVVEGEILLADQQLDKLPTESRFDLAHAGERLLKLNHEKKRFVDCLKVFVCNLRAEMGRLDKCSDILGAHPRRHAAGAGKQQP